jgi:beta-fructofuranosidase
MACTGDLWFWLSHKKSLTSKLVWQVDRTVIESFVQGGRMTMNTRSYPTVAYDRNALVFLFNNGTKAVNVRSLEIWQMQTCTNLSI